MSDGKACVKCGRRIDAVARICPFCNWDQNEPVVAKAQPAVGALPEYVPPSETRWRKPVFGAIGGVLGVILAFVIGIHVHGKKPPVVAADHEAPAAAAQGAERPHANVMLVPESGPAPSVEEPITSAPASGSAQGLNAEMQRTDATAASSAEYAQMAQRAQAERKPQAALVDPRSITGAAYDNGAPRRASSPPPMYSSSTERARPVPHTVPIPEYQPLPRMSVAPNSTAKVELMIGPDGRVHDINVRQGVGPNTGQLVAAMQGWRFKPATVNGNPVSAAFTVQLSFRQ
jgi:TonB family protein